MGDSWFGSTKVMAACCDAGLFGVFNVKKPVTCVSTPAAYIKDQIAELDRPFSIKMKMKIAGKDESFDIYLGGYKEKKPMVLIFSCLTMHPGEDRHFKVTYVNEQGEQEETTNTYPTTKVHHFYRKFFNRVDLHNKVRQEFMHFAECWLTNSWANRVIGEVMGVSATNTFLVAKFHFKDEFEAMGPEEFKHMLAYDMLNNPWLATDAIERPVSTVCYLVRPGGMTRCRYCPGRGKNTRWRCGACSTDKCAIGICGAVGGDCWRAHLAGEPKRKKAKSDSGSCTTGSSSTGSRGGSITVGGGALALPAAPGGGLGRVNKLRNGTARRRAWRV